MQPLRSFLFAPGNHARRVEKALSLDADAVILDLEDAVATAEKRATRDAVIAALVRPRRALLYVRVNAVDTEFCYGDLAAIVRPGLDGVILPKVESAAGLATADWLLAQLEREQGLMPRTIDLVPIIETARGLNQIDAILAAGTRVRHIAFGAGDFTLDVNMAWSRDEAELAYARAQIVTASRAAGIEAPFDTVWVDLADEEGLEASARTALGFGFQGKMCIHPNQIAVVNRVFTPSETEIAFAERVVAAFARAEAEGSAAIQLDGKFIDYPILYRAQRVLEKGRGDPCAGAAVMTEAAAGPLDGVTVLDLCSYLAGPYGCTLLADLGATVIKIESPQGDMLRQFPSSLAGESRFFLGANRGKRALALDLKQPEGLAVLHRMVETADVLVENFRPSVPARLGLDYPRLKAINPRLGLLRADRLRRRRAVE